MMALVKPRQVWHFAASHEGRPVGETALCGGAGVAGIYDVEVLKEFRRRGIGTAVVQAAAAGAAVWPCGGRAGRHANGFGRLCAARLSRSVQIEFLEIRL